MAEQNIAYKILSRGEIFKFDEIDRYELIEEIYYLRDDKLVLEKEYCEVKDFGYMPERIGDLLDIYDNGGTLAGAFDGDKLVGLGSICGELIGKEKNMIQLATLHVSTNYRDRGIGRKIVFILKEKAKQIGAEKLYVSATPSKHTVDFYRGAGFELTPPVKELFEKEPEDIHMEMLL